jgi:glycosyltransferase involved in cell wall biosynthesis
MLVAPLVSVLMPAWNVAPFIGAAIASVLRQTLPNLELLVVDDGSTDATASIVTGQADFRVRLLRQANAGVSAARNLALAEASGQALLFLDADDMLAPDALARLAKALWRHPQAAAAAGPYAFVPEAATPADPLPLPRRPRFSAGDVLERLLVENLFANGGHLLLRRDAARAAGGFLAGMRYGEDWEYWVRICLQGPLAVADGEDPVLLVRQRRGSAYHRMATDPRAFLPAMQAIYGNPALMARLGAERLATLRRRAEAENDWIIGRELLRHGQRQAGLARLHASLRAAPSPKRAVLMAAAHAAPLLPARLHGPFGRYAT